MYKKPIKVAELAVTDFLLAPKIAATATSVMDAFIAIKTARNTLKGMAMTGEQKGELLFQVICESKLNNALIKSWEELKQKNSDPIHPLGHTTAPEELDEVILGYYDLLLTFETNKKMDSKTSSSSEKKKNRKALHGLGPHGAPLEQYQEVILEELKEEKMIAHHPDQRRDALPVQKMDTGSQNVKS